jgi:DNA-binding LacI/PurR family transcriptional regulator
MRRQIQPRATFFSRPDDLHRAARLDRSRCALTSRSSGYSVNALLYRSKGVIVMTKQPTIRDVAERAGVSKSLVSLVLRGAAQVSTAKREAVLTAIDELGYRPNGSARSLTERRTRTVGVLLNDLRNPWFVELLEGLNSRLHERGLRTLLGDGRLDRRVDEALTQAFLEMRVDGLVLVGTMPESAAITEAATTLPTVVAGSRDLTLSNVDVVANDDLRGAELAVNHLVELGHRRIAHISGSLGTVAGLRRRGYVDTMWRHGLAERIEMSDLTEDGGYRAAVRLLSTSDGQRPTAIFAVNDIACVGAISAADELGINVPGQLSLVGYDNTYLAQLRHLSLTSVDNASYGVGRQAAKALLDRMAEPGRPASVGLIQPELRVRGSTAVNSLIG